MAKAKNSTKAKNEAIDPTRRRLITVAAGGAVAALAITSTAEGAAGLAEPDPIWVAIERHRQSAKLWESAVDAEACFPGLDMNDEQARQFEVLQQARQAARDTLDDASIDLLNTVPTTLAGIVTAIQYMQIQMRNDGTFMPHWIELKFDPGCEGDAGHVLGWIEAFLDTIADAAGDLLARQEGTS
jgi:hypothetical protein